MARKQVKGQLDLFAYINSIQTTEHFGDMEMVSLMPEDDPVIDESEAEVVEPEAVELEPEAVEPEPVAVEPEPEAVESEPENIATDTTELHTEKDNFNKTEDVSPEILPEKEFKIEISPSAVYNEREKTNSDLVMSKYFVSKQKKEAFVEYRNYNRVLVGSVNEPVKEYHFETSKEAVDFYVNVMYQFLDDKNLVEKEA